MDIPNHELQEVLGLLGSIPLLQRLPAASFDEIARIGQLVRFGKGDLVVRGGEPGAGLYIIWKGEAMFSEISEEDKAQHSSPVLRSGDFFGQACAGPQKELPKCDIIARSEVTCFVVRHEHAHLLSPASTWRGRPGDLAPVERLLQLDSLEVDLFQSRPMAEAPSFWDNMYGGHVVGLALVAATKTVDPALSVHSLHSYFIRSGIPSLPIIFKVERTRDGHTFATRHVQSKQKGKIMFTMYASFQLPTYEEILGPLCNDARLSEHNRQAATSSLKMSGTLDLKYVNRRSPLALEPAQAQQRVWMRTKGTLSDDPALHKCAAGYAFDWSFLETALGPHNKRVNTYAIMGLSLDHSMWFHKPFRADEWLLVAMESPRACNTRALCIGRAYTQSGEALVVTVQNTECVWEDVDYDGDIVSGNFVVLDHEIFWGADHPGIELIVTGPDGRTVHTSNTNEGEKFEFMAHRRGRYKFCFHNSLSAPEQVTFYIHVGHIPGIEDLARDEHLKPVDVKIAQLAEALEAVSAEIRYLQNRDLRHRWTNQSTQKRMITYTICEYLLLVAASIGQVYMIRRLFSKRIGYNRV